MYRRSRIARQKLHRPLSGGALIIDKESGIVFDDAQVTLLKEQTYMSRFIGWFGGLSDLGQMIVWLIVLMPIFVTALVIFSKYLNR